MTDHAEVRSLWIGGELSIVETLCIRSFLANGHPFVLYTYGEIDNVPTGVQIRDANQILPESKVFQSHGESYAIFSDWFRWEMLFREGGWWVDMDVVCLAPFDFPEERVFAKESDGTLGTAVMNFPREDALCRKMRERCLHPEWLIQAPKFTRRLRDAFSWKRRLKNPIEHLKWGEIAGPIALTQIVDAEGLMKLACPFFTFYPVNHLNALSVVNRDMAMPETSALLSASHAIHLWNEVLRRNRLDTRNVFYDRDSLFARLLHRYGVR